MTVVDGISDAAGRARKNLSLKMQLESLYGKRKELMTQLGVSAYDSAREDAYLRDKLGDLYYEIWALDSQCESVKLELSNLDSPTSGSKKRCSNPGCGAELPRDAQFCHYCGREQSDGPSSAHASVTPDAAIGGRGDPESTPKAKDSGEEPMNTMGSVPIPLDAEYTPCPICQQPVPLDDEFCMYCGQKLGDRTPKLTCPNCNAPVNPGDNYCGRCQRKLD